MKLLLMLIFLHAQKSTVMLVGIFVESLIVGTFLWSVYPFIHQLFPSAANMGIIATHLNWFSSVGIVFLIKLLFRNDINIENKTITIKDENKS